MSIMFPLYEENDTYQVVDKEANPHNSPPHNVIVHVIVTRQNSLEVTVYSPFQSLVHAYIPELEDEYSGSDDTPNPIARLETIRLLIALIAGKGWKIHHLDVKKAFLHVPNGEFIIVAVNVDDLFVTGTSLDLINEFKRRMTSQFEMSNLDLTYSVGVVSRYMQSPKKSHARAIKQILRHLKGTTSFGIKYKRGNDMKLVGYSDSSHNVDIDMMHEALLDIHCSCMSSNLAKGVVGGSDGE
ncbi:uncharacterized mitochondrial protein-like protein [Tanacetum coccineum]